MHSRECKRQRLPGRGSERQHCTCPCTLPAGVPTSVMPGHDSCQPAPTCLTGHPHATPMEDPTDTSLYCTTAYAAPATRPPPNIHTRPCSPAHFPPHTHSTVHEQYCSRVLLVHAHASALHALPFIAPLVWSGLVWSTSVPLHIWLTLRGCPGAWIGALQHQGGLRRARNIMGYYSSDLKTRGWKSDCWKVQSLERVRCCASQAGPKMNPDDRRFHCDLRTTTEPV